jgi:hypothetical protein
VPGTTETDFQTTTLGDKPMSNPIFGKLLAGGMLSGLFSLLVANEGLAQKAPDFSANQAG